MLLRAGAPGNGFGGAGEVERFPGDAQVVELLPPDCPSSGKVHFISLLQGRGQAGRAGGRTGAPTLAAGVDDSEGTWDLQSLDGDLALNLGFLCTRTSVSGMRWVRLTD